MKPITAASLLIALVLCPPRYGWAQPPPDANTPRGTEPLKVLLQGNAGSDLRALVESSGGEITHDLHIINAVGAMVSRQQLNKILKSPLVTRYVDDLSTNIYEKDPREEAAERCNIGGALEVEMDNHKLSWRLYNKNEEPQRLTSLSISWPASLGKIFALSLAGTKLNTASGEAGKLTVTPEASAAPVVQQRATLEATFTTPPNLWTENFPLQRDFEIKVDYEGGCSSKLIPGYQHNHENTYYPTVIGADAVHLQGVTGKGVTVAILDSGLWEIPSLATDTHGKPRVLARYDAIAGAAVEVAFDESGHGTHMASVLANSAPVTKNGEPVGTFKGIAPDVNLVIVKAFDVEGHGDFLDIVRGIQFVVDNREKLGIKVLNLSFAARPRWDYWMDPINQAVMRAWASGITVVAAAGNEGPEQMTIGSPGNLPYIITVGAVTDSWTVETRDDDYIPDFSSQGPTPNAHIKPDLVAPGGHMTGITRPGSTLTRDYPDYLLNTGEFVMTGTSQASALVAGVAALLLQLEPDLGPDDIKCKLMSSAEPAIDSNGLLAYSPFQQGSGYISVVRAITLGNTGCGNIGLDIDKDMANIDHYQGPAIILEDGTTSLPGLDTMVSSEPPEKGMSKSRKWGAKEHIERDNPTAPTDTPFDWETIYLEEQSRMEDLARDPR